MEELSGLHEDLSQHGAAYGIALVRDDTGSTG
jgi:hypothetical protein